MRTAVAMAAVVCCLAGNAPAWAQTAREVSYTQESIVPLKARLRFTTMIILPEQEEILDFVCGDKEFWIVSGGQNLAYVKPARAGATTNLNLVTASGRVYPFVLTESPGEPDLKVFVRPDGSMAPMASDAKFYSAAQVAKLQREAEDARKAAEDSRQQMDAVRAAEKKAVQDGVDKFREAYPTQLTFPYRFKPHQRPFNVSAIYTDGRFTYVRAEPKELPALYELLDDGARHESPNLVNFQVEGGLYIVPKVLERGYLAIGKRKLTFEKIH